MFSISYLRLRLFLVSNDFFFEFRCTYVSAAVQNTVLLIKSKRCNLKAFKDRVKIARNKTRKLPTSRGKKNSSSSYPKTGSFPQNSNPKHTSTTQLTSHNSLPESDNKECSILDLEKQTSSNTKGKYNNSSEKKEESTEQSKCTELKQKASDDDKLIVNDGNLLKDNSFPTGIEALDNFLLNIIVTNFLFARVKFLDNKIDLMYSEKENSVSHFVLGMLTMRTDVNLQTY